MPSELSIREEIAQDSVKVSVSGEIDIYTAQDLKDRLYNIMDTKQQDLKIDCSSLNYIDSTGLGVFVGTLKKARQYGKDIYLFNMKENIKKLFLITGLDKLFILGQ